MEDIENNSCLFYLALGSNLGDRKKNIERAYREIEKRIGIIKSKSAFYYSKPAGFNSPNEFVNSVCEVESRMNAYSLFAEMESIEKEMGRLSKTIDGRYGDRIIDIDLLLAGDRVIKTARLTIPHPKLHKRNFVLIPLCEIAPNIVHPIFAKTICELKSIGKFSDAIDGILQ